MENPGYNDPYGQHPAYPPVNQQKHWT
jgi:hypothetical protein